MPVRADGAEEVGDLLALHDRVEDEARRVEPRHPAAVVLPPGPLRRRRRRRRCASRRRRRDTAAADTAAAARQCDPQKVADGEAPHVHRPVRAQPPRERVGALRARDLLVGVDDQDHLVRIARRVGLRAALRARRVRAEVRAGLLSGMIDFMRRSTSCVASRGALPADAPAASTASAAAAPRAATPLAVTPPGSTVGAFTVAALGLCEGTSWLRGW